jgi:hypothetical protein
VHNRQIISTVFRVNMLARLASEGRKLIAHWPVSMLFRTYIWGPSQVM